MLLLIFVLLIIAGWQIPKMIQGRYYKELIVFLVIWLIAGSYGFIVLNNIPLVSPFKIIVKTVETISEQLPLKF